jgi:hypothetical protein
MKILLSFLFSAAFFISQLVYAHGEHGHDEPRMISEPVALIVAQRASANMSRKDTGSGLGQLGESWSSIPNENLALFKKGNGYYVVSVLNTTEEKTLYVFMSQSGEVYDANFTGEFDGIK